MKSVVSKKAFTIVELLVAMGLVVILVALSSLIFAAGVKAHRLADSTIEITRRAEAISRQLVADVGGLRTDAPLAIWFENAFVDTTGDGVADTYRRFDQILFFANGDFQTMRQYNGQTVSGNVSRIHYGHAWQVDSATGVFNSGYRSGLEVTPGQPLPPSYLLSRRAHVQTSDASLLDFPNPDQFLTAFTATSNNILEYDKASLAEWKNLMQTQDNCNQMLLTCFRNGTNVSDTGRPMIDMTNIDTLHLLLSEQISEFKVQWAFKSEDLIDSPTGNPFLPDQLFSGLLWWPESGDLLSFVEQRRGVFFNMPGIVPPSADVTPPDEWDPVSACKYSPMIVFSPTYVPRALKFTFTVHDAKGLFPEGKTFTQIVKIDN